MGLDSSLMTGALGGNSRLVKGCPCLKEFGEEKVCLNNDDVIPVTSIVVDPMFLGDAASVEDIANLKSDNESMCYLLVYLDSVNDQTYCVSQGNMLRINNREVKASEIQAALQFVTTSEQASDGIVCSACLYKYLVTLGDTFDDVLTETERTELVSKYIRDITTQMASDLIGTNEDTDPEIFDELVSSRINQLMALRTFWASLLHDLKVDGEDERLIRLVDQYRQLSRLETVFLFQVTTLRESDDKQVSIGLLRFMIEVAERVIRVVTNIRESSHDLLETVYVPIHIQKLLENQTESRNQTEEWFTNLVRMLNTIEIRTSQKSS
ncbi:MAG: hypothetical protein ACFFD6_02140 [Candidatus Thorarchaeota archaeon]